MTTSTLPATGSAIRLDDLDHRILDELSRDGRTRVRALEENGVIKGYAAIIDRAAVGLPETIVVEVTLEKQRHTGNVLDAFEKAIANLPQVIEAALVAGDFDYYLRVAASSTTDYERFLREKLYRIPGVRQARSIFILREMRGHPHKM
jgi:Lrp/AsnC family leucine-responsive transcriptional regulator